jgi:hypothetical protein
MVWDVNFVLSEHIALDRCFWLCYVTIHCSCFGMLCFLGCVIGRALLGIRRGVLNYQSGKDLWRSGNIAVFSVAVRSWQGG